jgi:transcriptional regulator with XRE-family HTH domain
MKPSEFRELINGAGLSQSEVARQLEISDRTIRRYLAARAAVPTLVVRAVMHLIAERTGRASALATSTQLRGRHNV